MGWHTHDWVVRWHEHEGRELIEHLECDGCDVKDVRRHGPPPPPPVFPLRVSEPDRVQKGGSFLRRRR